MGRVTMMTAGFALVTALAGCDSQGNVAGMRQAPMFMAGCDGNPPRQWPEARKAPRWHNGSGNCAAEAGGDGESVWTVLTGERVFSRKEEAASGGVWGATGGGAVDRFETGSGETPAGVGGTGGNGGDGGSGGAGTETGGAGGAGTETGSTGGTGGDGGTGGAGTETGGAGGSGGSGGTGTETGGTGGSGGDGQSGGTGTETGDTGGTGGDPVREHTGKPEDGITGKPENLGPPPETGNTSNAGGRGRP